MIYQKRVKGFSILELMVVVAIIGILATIAVQKWREYQSKTRDNIRKTTLLQLSKALEVYYIKHKAYPNTGSVWSGYCSQDGSKGFTGADGYIPGLAPMYINILPRDPLANGGNCVNAGYIYKSNGVGYKLVSHRAPGDIEGPESFPAAGEPFHDPKRPTWAYMICEGATACTTW